MTRTMICCIAALLVAACGADGPPEPVGETKPSEDRSIGVTAAINVEGVL